MYLRWIALCLVCFPLACVAAEPSATAGRGLSSTTLKTWPSPKGGTVIVQELVGAPGDIEQYALSVRRGSEHAREIFRFGRGVNVIWSPDNHHVAVTNYVGSNVATCSIFDIHNLDHNLRVNLPKSADFSDAHVYVTCGSWNGSYKVRVEVTGHTDTPPTREFDYHLIYDIRRMTLRDEGGTGLQLPSVGKHRAE